MKKLIALTRYVALVALTAGFNAASLTAASFKVENVNDTGPGSFHQAILDANANPGLDTIAFDIPGPGPHVIQPTTDLPFILESVVIDGYTQPGAVPNSNGPAQGLNTVLKVEIDGSQLASSKGLLFNATVGSVLRGLAVYGFPFTGNQFDQGIRLEGGGDNIIEGCFIGTDSNGTTPRGNNHGIILRGSSGNLIGGNTAAARNLISGNDTQGIWIHGASTDNVIIGNLIGTDILGTLKVGNGQNGASIMYGPNRVGGSTSEERNVISGNAAYGILVWSGDEILIIGNYLGVDVTGTEPLGNSAAGIRLRASASAPAYCTVGGLTPGERNILSANGAGIVVGGHHNAVLGNFIGTDVTGTLGLGNTANGVFVAGAHNMIGGPTSGAGNLISGNGAAGIGIRFSSASDNVVQGNQIGTDVTGTLPLGNGAGGVSMAQCSNNLIGGSEPGAGNVIAANQIAGVGMSGTTDTTIQGNFIGTDKTATLNLGNAGRGVSMQFSERILVGGIAPDERNIIANNAESGIAVFGGVLQASFRGNAIYDNSGLGIDFFNTGPTLNDPGDFDIGPNNLQNYPLIVDAAATATSTWIAGFLDSTANTEFQIDFYANGECDPSGFGEGAAFLGTATVITDATGLADFEVVLGVGASVGSIVTATATDPDGNTSEFSPCLAQVVQGALSVLIDIKPNDYPNCFNNDGQGVIPVAILGAADFDVSEVDPASVTLEGMGIRLSGNGKKLLAHFDDITQDGFLDLIMQIEDLDGVFEPGTSIALLQGQLYDGTPFEGTDEVCIVPNP